MNVEKAKTTDGNKYVEAESISKLVEKSRSPVKVQFESITIHNLLELATSWNLPFAPMVQVEAETLASKLESRNKARLVSKATQVGAVSWCFLWHSWVYLNPISNAYSPSRAGINACTQLMFLFLSLPLSMIVPGLPVSIYKVEAEGISAKQSHKQRNKLTEAEVLTVTKSSPRGIKLVRMTLKNGNQIIFKFSWSASSWFLLHDLPDWGGSHW